MWSKRVLPADSDQSARLATLMGVCQRHGHRCERSRPTLHAIDTFCPRCCVFGPASAGPRSAARSTGSCTDLSEATRSSLAPRAEMADSTRRPTGCPTNHDPRSRTRLRNAPRGPTPGARSKDSRAAAARQHCREHLPACALRLRTDRAHVQDPRPARHLRRTAPRAAGARDTPLAPRGRRPITIRYVN